MVTGSVTVSSQQILQVSLTANYPADAIVLASIQTDDTGGTLGRITIARRNASNSLLFRVANAPTNNDGEIRWLVIVPE